MPRAFFFRQAISIDAGQRFHQRCLAVVDMPAVPMIMPAAAPVAGKADFVGRIEAAQIKAQGIVGNASDHRLRQAAQPLLPVRPAACGAFFPDSG